MFYVIVSEMNSLELFHHMVAGSNYRQAGAFHPLNTLSSIQEPNFDDIENMVNQREPPRMEGISPKPLNPVLSDRTNQPEFGKASPLRNPVKASSNGIFFKPRQPIPEAQRSAQANTRSQLSGANPPFRMPGFTSANNSPTLPSEAKDDLPSGLAINNYLSNSGVQRQRLDISNTISLLSSTQNSPSFIEVPRPAVFAARAIPPTARPNYSSNSGFQPPNVFRSPKLRDDDDDFNPDQAFSDIKFAEPDPFNYVDAAQASENIKALLEGAFEDDDDKPKTRLRKKKQDVAASDLADQLAGLKVGDKHDVDEADEEEEDDDGTVEGLKVKLLPHQIDGVTWMIDREIGGKKKNGVSPKGGILADDVSTT